jgi:hypothetical protein
MRRLLRFLSRDFLDFSDFTSSGTAGWAANRSLNFLFTVRSGTTRERHRNNGRVRFGSVRHSRESPCSSRWAEPPIMEGKKMESLGNESSPGLSVLHTRRFNPARNP